MNETNIRESFNQKAKLKRIIFLFIVYTVILVCGIITAVQKSEGGTILKVLEWLNDKLLKMEEIAKIIDLIQGVLLTMGIIDLVPLMLLVLGFLFLAIGSRLRKPDAVVKLGLVNLSFSKFFALLKIIGTWICIIVASAIIGSKFPAIPGYVIVAFDIIMICKSLLDFWLTLKLYFMSVGASHSYMTDELHYKSSVFVRVYFVILVIFKVIETISSFIGKINISGIISAVFTIASYIVLITIFNAITKEYGYPPREDRIGIKNVFQTQFYDTIHVFKDNGYTPKPQKVVKQQDIKTVSKPVKNQKYKAKGINAAIAAVSEGKNYDTNLESINVKVLDLFKKDSSVLEKRFTTLGEASLHEESKCPVKLIKASVILDTLSQRKILRIEGLNNSPVEITEVVLKIVPKGNLFNELGIMEEVKYDSGVIKSGEKFLANFGVVLPDDTTSVEMNIIKVTFKDGLYYDAADVAYNVITEEKAEFDIKLYNELLNN